MFFFSLSILLLQALFDGSALWLSATGCLSSALQRQVPWRSPGASEPVEQNGVGTAMGMDANRTRLYLAWLVNVWSSKLCANPLQAYQSTVWPNRDGLLGLRRPPSSLNRLYTRPRGPAPGRSYRLAVLYLGRRRHGLRTVPAAESESTVTTPTVTNWQRPLFPTRTLTLPLFPGLAPLVCLPSTAKNKTVPSLAWRQSLRFSSSLLSSRLRRPPQFFLLFFPCGSASETERRERR